MQRHCCIVDHDMLVETAAVVLYCRLRGTNTHGDQGGLTLLLDIFVLGCQQTLLGCQQTRYSGGTLVLFGLPCRFGTAKGRVLGGVSDIALAEHCRVI